MIKWAGIIGAILLIVACLIPWVHIESKDIVVSGIHAEGTNFGKPGYFHLFMSGLFIVFTVVGRVWSTRSNVLIAALNLGWAIRNYFIITQCRGGDCPVKELGIYLMLVGSGILLIASLFPDVRTTK